VSNASSRIHHTQQRTRAPAGAAGLYAPPAEVLRGPAPVRRPR
jgi:hypothetical protein